LHDERKLGKLVVMNAVTFKGRIDGKNIVLERPTGLAPNTPVLIQIMASGVDAEREDWHALAADGLAHAYGDNEPEYTLDMIREKPTHESR
jgi:hypothetical protein